MTHTTRYRWCWGLLGVGLLAWGSLAGAQQIPDIVCTSLACFPANEGPWKHVNKGDTALVPYPLWTWINIKNLEPVRHANGVFHYDGTCSLHQGGTVAVLALDENQVLARYTIEGEQAGASCPSGVIFFLEATMFARMEGEAQRHVIRQQREKARIKQLLER